MSDLQYVTLPWQNYEHRWLPYKNFPYNDPTMPLIWKTWGYDVTKLTGDMYDMKNPHPEWFDMSVYEKILGWKHLSWSFYRMRTMTVLPEHVDTYNRFKILHPEHTKHTIMRAIVFLEKWRPGHVLTLGNKQVEQWNAGDFVTWEDDTPHLAANIGLEDRYTLQLTGYK